jgi:hypothetical protein
LTLTRSENRDRKWVPGGHDSTESIAAILGAFDRDVHNAEGLIDRNGHGTHVAAIVGGQFDPSAPGIETDGHLDGPVFGVAPKCKLMSLKVLDDRGTGSEFEILRALHLVLAQNEIRPGSIHVVLIPLSLLQDVRNYACGRTPVCEVVERLVESGVVVIAPSGNRGYGRFAGTDGDLEVASLMNITDPGNAEHAITVGATHSFLPVECSASYFSSRGPTADGRDKPDLLAPGERILSASPVPVTSSARPPSGKNARKQKRRPRVASYAVQDGTSSAAAFVAGAVAAILSARPDLIGHPQAVKDLLLASATDLGRHKWIQGRGLLNLSRALGTDVRIEAKPRLAETTVPLSSGSAQLVIDGPVAKVPAPAPRAKRFSVALSFSGLDRKYVEKVLARLRESLDRSEVFYDRYYPHETIRPNLDSYLLDIYNKQSELVVVFLSAAYDKADWCGLEWRAVRDLIKTRADYAVMPIRLDDTPIEGLLSIDGYYQARGKDAQGKDFERDPELVGDLIVARLALNREKGLT